jgi:hypothetical protein
VDPAPGRRESGGGEIAGRPDLRHPHPLSLTTDLATCSVYYAGYAYV